MNIIDIKRVKYKCSNFFNILSVFGKDVIYMRRIPLRALFREIVLSKLIIIICIYDNRLKNKDLQYVQSCREKYLHL